MQRIVAMFKCHRTPIFNNIEIWKQRVRCGGTGLLIPEETGKGDMHWGDGSAGNVCLASIET